jgi:hypothetical protein
VAFALVEVAHMLHAIHVLLLGHVVGVMTMGAHMLAVLQGRLVSLDGLYGGRGRGGAASMLTAPVMAKPPATTTKPATDERDGCENAPNIGSDTGSG